MKTERLTPEYAPLGVNQQLIATLAFDYLRHARSFPASRMTHEVDRFLDYTGTTPGCEFLIL